MFDAESESKKQEIFDLLLVAGYFRIRIPSLDDFDKILGGIAWGILCSGFDIDLDLDYNDELRLKEKIKLAERIVRGLKNMNCPHPLQPHQIQGLDYGSIHPVIKWLLQFVFETRQLRQDENESISSQIGMKLITNREVRVYETPAMPLAKPLLKNKKVQGYSYSDPLRVYSALAEYGNKKAAGYYKKLLIERNQLTSEEAGKKDASASSVKPNPGSLADELKAGLGAKGLKKTAESGSAAKNRKNSEEDIAEVQADALEGFVERPRLARRNSISADDFMELLEENKAENEKIAEKIKEIEEKAAEGGSISALQQETTIFQEQKQELLENIESMKTRVEDLGVKNTESMSVRKKVLKDLEAVRVIHSDLNAAIAKIESEIRDRESKLKKTDIEELNSLISKQMVIKERKTELKTQAKEESKKVKAEVQKIEKKLQEVSKNQEIVEINEVYDDRRTIYLAKEAQLAEVSKETALLMRRIQEFPNNIEISQFSKRYVDLVDKIRKESENQKKLDTLNNGKIDIDRMCTDFFSLLKSIKENLVEVKKDKQRKELAENMDTVGKGLGQNLDLSKGAFKRATEENESLLTDLDKQLTFQREYYQLLQRIQLAYER
jgi:CCDC93, coiled-coil domain